MLVFTIRSMAMAREITSIKKAIKRIKHDCEQIHEIYEDLGNTYEKISNIKGEGYENKYNLITILSTKALYSKKFTAQNDFGGWENIDLAILKPKENGVYMILFCGFQGNIITRIEIYNCGGNN